MFLYIHEEHIGFKKKGASKSSSLKLLGYMKSIYISFTDKKQFYLFSIEKNNLLSGLTNKNAKPSAVLP